MLSVAVDCRKISHYGIGNVVRSIVTALGDAGFYVTAFGVASEIRTFYPRIKVIPFEVHHNNPFAYLYLKQVLRRNPEFDCWVSPHYVGVWPLEFRLSKRKHRLPIICYLHDLIHLSWPTNFFLPVVSKAVIQNMVRSVDLVLTPSDYTRKVAKQHGFDSTNWQILSPPVSEDFLRVVRDLQHKPPPQRDEYYLCVTSSLKPHKGVSNLIKIWRSDYPPLKIVGNVGGIKVGAKTNIHVVPKVPLAELINLYSSAKWVIIPSLAEGFGYVYLESRYTLTPVICRPLPCFNDFKASVDIVCEDMTDESLRAGIELSLSRTPSVDEVEFTAIQAKFDKRVFTTKLKNLVEWVCNACSSSRLDTSY